MCVCVCVCLGHGLVLHYMCMYMCVCVSIGHGTLLVLQLLNHHKDVSCNAAPDHVLYTHTHTYTHTYTLWCCTTRDILVSDSVAVILTVFSRCSMCVHVCL